MQKKYKNTSENDLITIGALLPSIQGTNKQTKQDKHHVDGIQTHLATTHQKSKGRRFLRPEKERASLTLTLSGKSLSSALSKLFHFWKSLNLQTHNKILLLTD